MKMIQKKKREKTDKKNDQREGNKSLKNLLLLLQQTAISFLYIREVISGTHCDHSVLDCEDKTYTILFKDSRRIKLKIGSIFSSICVISHVSSCRILAESERRDVRIKIDIRGFTVKATWLPSLKEMRTSNIPSTKQRM